MTIGSGHWHWQLTTKWGRIYFFPLAAAEVWGVMVVRDVSDLPSPWRGIFYADQPGLGYMFGYSDSLSKNKVCSSEEGGIDARPTQTVASPLENHSISVYSSL